jgi:hypothetical protein
VPQLEHPRSEYQAEFKKMILYRQAAITRESLEQLRIAFEARLENQVAVRMQHDKVDRDEALSRSLNHLHGCRQLLTEAMGSVMEQAKENTRVELLKLEQWAAS